MSVTIVRVGPDPFGRGERTVFYRDSSINGSKEVFYLWACHWKTSYPDISIPADGFDSDIFPPEKTLIRTRPPGSCVPYVLSWQYEEDYAMWCEEYKNRFGNYPP